MLSVLCMQEQRNCNDELVYNFELARIRNVFRSFSLNRIEKMIEARSSYKFMQR